VKEHYDFGVATDGLRWVFIDKNKEVVKEVVERIKSDRAIKREIEREIERIKTHEWVKMIEGEVNQNKGGKG
jgi:hypothetical protein